MEMTEFYRLVRGRIPEAVRHSDNICSEMVRHDFGHCPKPSGVQYAWREANREIEQVRLVALGGRGGRAR